MVFRQSDFTNTTHFNGLNKNWVQTLFLASSGTPFFEGGSAQALLASAGVDPDYADCGVNPSSATPCGPFGP